jgi:LAO/AO transport system kinase
VPGADRVPDLVDRARRGDPRAVARLVTLVEDGSPLLPELAAALGAAAAEALPEPRVIGLTGPPGVGKSTLTSALVTLYRARGERVAVIAVDPSSPFSGGALLGDRVRMQEHATDRGVFIRSMAARGQLGGLAAATPQAIRVLSSAGFDVVLVETVGVGQSEVAVASAADTVVLVLAPGMGDGVQAAKAGILEIGDIYVVNKADRDGAEATARELRHMVRLGRQLGTADGTGWDRPVLRTVAADGTGVPELVEAVDTHLHWADSTGALVLRRRGRAADEIAALALARLRAGAGSIGDDGALESLAERVRAGELDPYRAADELLSVSGVAMPAAP